MVLAHAMSEPVRARLIGEPPHSRGNEFLRFGLERNLPSET